MKIKGENIPYIYYLDEEGIACTTKYMQTKIPNVGDEIVTFYDETVKFYNLHGCLNTDSNYCYVRDGQLIEITKDDANVILTTALQSYLDSFNGLNIEAIHDVRDGEPSAILSAVAIANQFLKKICGNETDLTPSSYNNINSDQAIASIKDALNSIRLVGSLQPYVDDRFDYSNIESLIKDSLTVIYDELDIPITSPSGFNCYPTNKEIPDLPPYLPYGGRAYGSIVTGIPITYLDPDTYESLLKQVGNKNNQGQKNGF